MVRYSHSRHLLIGSPLKIFILFYCQSSQYDPFTLPIILHFDVDSANWASTQQVAAVFVRPVLVGLVCINTPRQPDIVIGWQSAALAASPVLALLEIKISYSVLYVYCPSLQV